MLEGTVTAVDGERIELAAQDGLTIRAESAVAVTKGQTAWFAVRPEKVRIGHDAPAGVTANAVAGEVLDIGYLGDMSIYHVRLGSGQQVRASLMNAERTVERPITWDDKVWLSWSPDAGVVLAK